MALHPEGPTDRSAGSQSQARLTCCEHSGTASSSWGLASPSVTGGVGPTAHLSGSGLKPGAPVTRRQRCQREAPPPLMSLWPQPWGLSRHIKASWSGGQTSVSGDERKALGAGGQSEQRPRDTRVGNEMERSCGQCFTLKADKIRIKSLLELAWGWPGVPRRRLRSSVSYRSWAPRAFARSGEC